jgi:prevent-host-death family protein
MRDRRVGLRELRRSFSGYLRRVERGERLEITKYGRPVAVLEPPRRPDMTLARLVAAGKVLPPIRDIRDLLPPPGRVSRRASNALLAEREERSS